MEREHIRINAQQMLDSLIAVRDSGKDLSKLDVIVILTNEDRPVNIAGTVVVSPIKFDVYYAHKCTFCGWDEPGYIRVGAFFEDKMI